MGDSPPQTENAEQTPSRRWVALTVAGTGAVAAVAMLAVGWVFNQIEAAIPSIAAEYRSNPAFRPWPGWTERYMMLHPVWFGFVFAAGYALVNRLCCPARTWGTAAARGATYWSDYRLLSGQNRSFP